MANFLGPDYWRTRCHGDNLGQWAQLKVTFKPLFTYCDRASKRQKWHWFVSIPFLSSEQHHARSGGLVQKGLGAGGSSYCWAQDKKLLAYIDLGVWGGLYV